MDSLDEYDAIWKQLESFKINIDSPKKRKCDCEIDPDVIDTNNTLVCNNCGIVFELSRISDEAEWTGFTADESSRFKVDGNRCGGPIDFLMPKSSLSTMISGPDTPMKRRNMWLSLPYEEKVLYDIKIKLTQIVALYSLPTILIRNTMIGYNQFMTDTQSHRGAIKTGILAVIFYTACKNIQCNMTCSNITSIFEINTKIFTKCSKIYAEKSKKNNENINNNLLTDNFVTRYCNQLQLPFKIEKLCKNIIIACKDLGILNNVSSQILISGVIHFINLEMDINILRKNIANICDISEASIAKISKILIKNKNELFNIVKQL